MENLSAARPTQPDTTDARPTASVVTVLTTTESTELPTIELTAESMTTEPTAGEPTAGASAAGEPVAPEPMPVGWPPRESVDEGAERCERPIRMLVVWCPDWPVVAACAETGVLPQVPVAVVRTNRVLACSASARTRGVRRGMRRREAQSCCTELLVFLADPDRDARAFEPVAAAVEDLAPGVEIVRAGVVAVPARGPVSYFGGEEPAAERIVDQVASVAGVECQVGIADGLFAAVLAAHRGLIVSPGGSRAFLAPLSIGELATFTGQVGVGQARPIHYGANQGGNSGKDGSSCGSRSSGQLDNGRAVGNGRVGGVRIGSARVGGGRVDFVRPSTELAGRLVELIDLLRRLGLRTLGAFAALSEGEVASRFGADAALAHRLANGQILRPPDRRRTPPELVVTQVLDPPAERVDMVAFAAKAAAQRLHELLGSHGLACTRLGVEAETEQGEQHSKVWRCAEPLTLAGIADRVRWQLDGWLRTARLSSGVSLLRLWPEEVVDGQSLQLRLFAGGKASAADDERAGRAMLRVQSLLGPDGVFTAIADGGRAPADRVSPVAWGDERIAHKHPELPWPGQLPRPSPATVVSQPVSVLVVDDGWEPVALTDRHRLTAPPSRVVLGTRLSLRVMGWAGPWFADRNPAMAGGGVRSARLQVLLDRSEAEQSDGTCDGKAHSGRARGGGEQGDKTQDNRARNKRAQGRSARGEPWWDGWVRNESAQLEEDAAAPPSSLALLLRCEDSRWWVEGIYD